MDGLVQRLQDARRIGLISHLSPDGDAIGSLLALHLGLAQLGKQMRSALVDGVPRIFAFLPQSSLIEQSWQGDDLDLVVVLDASDAIRTGLPEEIKRLGSLGKLAYIDHHARGDLRRLTKICLHDESASSTAELVYRVLNELGVRLTPAMATCLLTGIYTDTGGFQHPNTTTETMEIAAELMRRGGRLSLIAGQIAHNKSIAGLKLLGIALQRLVLTRGGSCAVSCLTQADIAACGATEEDLSGIIGQLNVLPGIKVCMLLTEREPGLIRGALRTGEGSRANVYHLARLLGGGGHPRASGFSLPGHLRQQANGGWEVVAP